MDKPKIDFNNISTINCSSRSQSHHTNEENYINENIFFYCDDNEADKKELKKNSKFEFERVLNQMKLKCKSISENPEKIMKSNFSLKYILANKLNIQALQKKENIISKDNSQIINCNSSINSTNKINMTNNNGNIFNINNNYNGNSSNNSNSSSNINSNYSFNSLNSKIRNHFKVIEPLNSNTQNNIFSLSSNEAESPKLIGKKRKQQNNIEKIEEEKKTLFNDILFICNEISIIKNDIIKKEEQNNQTIDNENVETTLIINNIPIATIYLNRDIVYKIYSFKNKKTAIKENEILSALKNIKKSINSILNKLRKNK
jgi:hypothetical protein